MKSIWKYTLGIMDRQSVQMPKGAKTLTAQIQNDQICVWAVCDPDAETENRTFFVIGTGNPFDAPPMAYVGTVQLHGGRLVFHIFVEIP